MAESDNPFLRIALGKSIVVIAHSYQAAPVGRVHVVEVPLLEFSVLRRDKKACTWIFRISVFRFELVWERVPYCIFVVSRQQDFS